MRFIKLLFGIQLMLLEKVRMELHISRLINAMNVSECSGDAEIGSYLTEGLVDVINVFGLSVQASVVDAGVIDAIFLTPGDTDLHLEPDTKGCHTLEVFDTSGDIFFLWFFGKIEHVGGKEGFLMMLVVSFVCFKHSIEPRKKLFGTVIAVQNDRTANLS